MSSPPPYTHTNVATKGLSKYGSTMKTVRTGLYGMVDIIHKNFAVLSALFRKHT